MNLRNRSVRHLRPHVVASVYFSSEGTAQPVKIKTPLCLSFHPQNPATADEVVVLARRGGV